MLVGRELELGVLTSHFKQMLAGNGSVLFLTGEAGLGKTTLVHSWWNQIADSGLRNAELNSDPDHSVNTRGADPQSAIRNPQSAIFLESACSIPIGNVDVGRLEALQPWADIIAGISDFESGEISEFGFRTSDKNDLNSSFPKSEIRNPKSEKTPLNIKKLIHDAAPAWAWAIPFVGDIAHAALETSRLVREQRDGEGHMPAINNQQPEYAAQNQQQVFQQYVNLLTKVSAEIPLIIFLDDLHWADTSSCNLLFYLARQIADKRILILATYRQDDAFQAQDGKGHAIITIKNEILRYECGRELALELLGRSAIRALLQATFPDYTPDDRFETWLRKISDGNSLFVTQFIRTLREDGQLNEHGAFVGDYSNIAIPPTALAVVEERTRRLDEATRELLMFATAEGEEFTSYVLGQLVEKKPMELLKELQRVLKQGVIVDRGKARVFANQTTTIYGFSHALFHKALYGQLIEEQKEYLHRQCFELLKGEWDRLSETKQRTTTLATKLLTHAERCEEWQAVAEVALDAAREFWKSYNEEEALAMVERVFAAAENRPFLRQLYSEAQFLTANIHRVRGRYPEAIAMFRAAESGFRLNGMNLRANDALGSLAVCLADSTEYDASLELATRAYNEALEIGYVSGQAKAVNGIGAVHTRQGRYAQALEAFTTCVALRESIGDSMGAAVALGNVALVYRQQSDPLNALEQSEKALAIIQSGGDRGWEANALGNLGLIYDDMGRYEEALDFHKKALKIHDEIGERNGIGAALCNTGNTLRKQGRFAEAIGYLERSLEIFEAIGNRNFAANALAGLGELFGMQNQYDRALEYFERSLALRESIGDSVGLAYILAHAGNIHRLMGMHDRARECYLRCIALAHEYDVKHLFAEVSGELGLLAEAEANLPNSLEREEKRAEARRLIGEAITMLRELGNEERVAEWEKRLSEL